MKKVFLATLVTIFGLAGWSQDAASIYAAASGSVVYLQHQIILKSSDSTQPELWKRLEKLLKKSVLDSAWPLSSGSGFFLDNDGSILTNRHVVKIGSLDDGRRNMTRVIVGSLEQEYSSSFTVEERSAMKDDLQSMLAKGKYSFVAMQGGEDLGPLEALAVAAKQEPDLALLRVGGLLRKGIRLGQAELLGPGIVGNDVFSLGYPLGSELDTLFKERTVTMNRGAVSAFRDAELSIQHSAAISHGSSGGPLLNSEGLVVGVNTAGLQEREGNSLFYAIDAAKVRTWLQDRGFADVLKWNQRIASLAAQAGGPKLNALGEIEGSSDVILDVDRNVEVFLDGTRMGAGPTMLHLANPVSQLDLRGPSGTFSAKLRALSSISGSTTLRPRLAVEPVPVRFLSQPDGATIVADGKVLGRTPLSTALLPDAYSISLRIDGAWFADASFEVRRGAENVMRAEGLEAFRVTLEGAAPQGTSRISAESAFGKSSFGADETIYLPEGEWEVRVEGSELHTADPVRLLVGRQPAVIDLSSRTRTAPLKIRGLDTGASVWIDGKPFRVAGGDAFRLPLGVHTVYVWQDGLQPLEETKITVRGDGKSFVTWDRLPGHDVVSRRLARGGLGTAIAGGVLLGLGFVGNQNEIALGLTQDYQGYSTFRTAANVVFWAGSGLLGTSVIMEVFSLVEKKKYEAQRARMSALEQKK